MTQACRWLVPLVLATFGCDHSPTAPELNPPVLRWGTSFGMCAGYCTEVLEVDGARARLSRSSWQPERFPPRVAEIAVTDDEWRRLADAVDAEAVQGLREVYGCPDCADGGAEFVELETTSLRKRVTFEYGAPPAELRPLTLQLRALRQRFPAQ